MYCYMGADFSTPDLSSYATKTEVDVVDNKVKAIDLTRYYSKAEVNSKLSNITSTPGTAGKDGTNGAIGPAGPAGAIGPAGPSGPISSMPASLAKQGAYIGWNKDQGSGRALIANNRGTGGGGFDFIDYDSSGSSEDKYATWTPSSIQFHKDIKDKDGKIVGGNLDTATITSNLSASSEFQKGVAQKVVDNSILTIKDKILEEDSFAKSIKDDTIFQSKLIGPQGRTGTISSNNGLAISSGGIKIAGNLADMGDVSGIEWSHGLNIKNGKGGSGSWTHFNASGSGENLIRGKTLVEQGPFIIKNADGELTHFNHNNDNSNYIRGSVTNVNSPLNANNNLSVSGNLCIFNNSNKVCLTPDGGDSLLIWKNDNLGSRKVIEFGTSARKLAWSDNI